MDSIDERGIGELINIPDQYSQKGFDALLLDDRLFGKLAEGEIDQCVDCYRYLSFPIDDEDLKKKVLELLLNHPGHKIVLKGKFFYLLL